MPVVLVIETEDQIVREQLSARPLVLGRSSKCHVKLDDGKVSGKHLSIAIGKNGKTIVKDLETTNGTFLNGSKIMECHLFLDDEITIGEVKIFIDASKMGPKEINNHTRAGEKTQHTFIQLPRGTDSAIKEAMSSAKASQKSKPNTTKYKDESARQKEIMNLLKDDPEEKSDSPGLKTRIINKVKDLDKKVSSEGLGEVRDGENFDLEAPSGETQMLKIGRVKTTKKK